MQYGWSPKGKRSYAEQKGFKKQRLNIVAGYVRGQKKLLAPYEFEGHITGDIFTYWVQHFLCPDLKPGQTVILDNASFHKSNALEGIVQSAGCDLVYLPTYSPDLNPIEKVWSNLKREIRKVVKKCSTLQEAVTHAFKKTYSG